MILKRNIKYYISTGIVCGRMAETGIYAGDVTEAAQRRSGQYIELLCLHSLQLNVFIYYDKYKTILHFRAKDL